MTALALSTPPEPNADQDREFPFSDAEFNKLAKLVHNQAGIVLHASKKNMVYGRLARRLRKLGIRTFKEYIRFLDSRDGAKEAILLINAITTNLTKFFRESHHFDHLYQACIDITEAQSERGESRHLRIWSAGCSSGEEPYSIAIIMNELMENTGPFDIKILATDLDTSMLDIGRAGKYDSKLLTDLPSNYRKRYTVKISASQFQMKKELRKLIHFKQLNLLHPWPMHGPFDIIFCRNVMIYFDAKTKATLAQGFTDMLHPASWLYIGHSETLSHKKTDLELLGKTIYRRKDHVQDPGPNLGRRQA